MSYTTPGFCLTRSNTNSSKFHTIYLSKCKYNKISKRAREGKEWLDFVTKELL